MIKEASVKDEKVHVHVELTTPACPMKDRIRDDVVKAISDRAQSIGSPRPSVEVEFSADVRGRDGDGSGSPLAGVRHVIAVLLEKVVSASPPFPSIWHWVSPGLEPR